MNNSFKPVIEKKLVEEFKVIQALILAAGRGSRMLELTQKKPKCLIKLAGKTLLDWQTHALNEAGIKDIFIVRGYLAEVFDSFSRYKYFFNSDWDRTNILESLYCAKEALSQRITIISYSDIAYNSKIVEILLQSSSDIVITYDLLWQNLWEDRFSSPLIDSETFQVREGKLVEIGKSPTSLEEIQGQYMGLLKITPNGWAIIHERLLSVPIEKRRQMDMTTFLQYLIDSEICIEAIPISGKWCEVDSPKDLRCYEEKLREEKPWTHDWISA